MKKLLIIFGIIVSFGVLLFIYCALVLASYCDKNSDDFKKDL